MSNTVKNALKVKSKHGEYEIELLGNILRVDGRGVVTKQLLQQYHNDVKKITLPLGGQSWGFLGFVHGTGILTPEAELALVGSIQLRKTYGMSACALVTKEADIPTLVNSQFERVYIEAQIDYYFCSSEDEALAWLKTVGCSTNAN